MKTELHSTKLSNGITVITDRASQFQTAAVSMKFAVGSAHEPENLCGISHLLEHLIFRGSEKYSSEAFQRAIGSVGAEVNGCTDEDTTTFTACSLKEDLAHVLSVYADVLCQPLLSADDIDLEKQIVEQENCRGCSNCTMRESIYSVAYPDQSLRHPIIGYEDTISAITRNDLVAYHSAYYVTGNLIVSVVGDVAHEDVVAYVESAFANMAQGPAAPKPSFDFEPGEIAIGSGGDQAVVNILFDLSDLSLADRQSAVFYQDILGGHGHSKLMEELREKRGLVYNVHTYEDFIGNQYVMDLTAYFEARKAREVVGVIGDCMNDLATNLSEQELNDVKSRARIGILRGLDDPERRADENACDALYDGGHTSPQEKIAIYNNISLQAVRDAGQNLLKRDPAIFFGGSQRSMPKFDQIRASLKGQSLPSKTKKKSLFRLVS